MTVKGAAVNKDLPVEAGFQAAAESILSAAEGSK